MIETKFNLISSFNHSSTAVKAFLYVVILPTILAVIYYGLIASDIYISEARYAVRTHSEMPTSISFIDSVFNGGSTSASGDDAFIVKDYILSRDMLIELDKELDLRSHYQSRDIDVLTRMDDDASLEDFYSYYRRMVGVQLESQASVCTLTVKAFTPEFSQKIASLIISKSEELVNSMTERIVEDTLQFARNEVANAEQLVRKASDDVSRFRNESKTIDPGRETAAVLGIVTKLESSLAEAQAELIHAESYLNEDSTQIKILRAKVKALKTQIANERDRLADENDDTQDFTKLIYNYEPLVLEKTLAERQYTSALTSLELARAEAQRKQRYLIPFVTPKIPDEAGEPDRFMKITTVFFACLMFYAISGLIWAAIKDHMRN